MVRTVGLFNCASRWVVTRIGVIAFTLTTLLLVLVIMIAVVIEEMVGSD